MMLGQTMLHKKMFVQPFIISYEFSFVFQHFDMFQHSIYLYKKRKITFTVIANVVKIIFKEIEPTNLCFEQVPENVSKLDHAWDNENEVNQFIFHLFCISTRFMCFLISSFLHNIFSNAYFSLHSFICTSIMKQLALPKENVCLVLVSHSWMRLAKQRLFLFKPNRRKKAG